MLWTTRYRDKSLLNSFQSVSTAIDADLFRTHIVSSGAMQNMPSKSTNYIQCSMLTIATRDQAFCWVQKVCYHARLSDKIHNGIVDDIDPNQLENHW